MSPPPPEPSRPDAHPAPSATALSPLQTEAPPHTAALIIGLALTLFIVALDNTIVAAVMPTIVQDLGGLASILWVTSAYSTAQVAVMPVFGKLSDMYGHKRFCLAGIMVFLLGSALCGASQNILQLILARALQGIGGGAIFPIVFAILFDVFPPSQRGKLSGIFGALFGASSIIGPLVGSFITVTWSWHWIFFINIPIGLIATGLVMSSYHESKRHTPHAIDWLGAITLVAALLCFMFALELGGRHFAWSSTPIFSLLGAFVLLSVIFVQIERRAPEPVIIFALFRQRIFAMGVLTNMLYFSAYVVAVIFIPLYMAFAQGRSAIDNALVLVPMSFSAVLSSTLSGYMMRRRVRYRSLMLISITFFLIGLMLLSTLSLGTPYAVVIVYMAVFGFGMGFSLSVSTSAALNSVPPRQLGSASSKVALLRQLGLTLGISIFGTLQRNLMQGGLDTLQGPIRTALAEHPETGIGIAGGVDPQFLVSVQARAWLPAELQQQIYAAIAHSISETFLYAWIPAVLALVTICCMGNARVPDIMQATRSSELPTQNK